MAAGEDGPALTARLGRVRGGDKESKEQMLGASAATAVGQVPQMNF